MSERKLKKNKALVIRFSFFTLLYIIYVLFVKKGLPNLWWFWGLLTLFLDYYVAPTYSYVCKEWEKEETLF